MPPRSITGRAVPPSVRSLLYNLNFEANQRGAAWCYDTWQQWRDVMSHISDKLTPLLSTLPEPLRSAEYNHLEKGMVNWRHVGLGRMFVDQDAVTTSQTQAEALKPYLKKIGRAYERTIRSNPTRAADWARSAKIVVSSGKGAPNWYSATDDKVVPYIMSASGLGIGVSLANSGDDAKTINPLGLVITMLQRIQGARKPSQTYMLRDGYLIPAAMRMVPKVRDVKAVPLWVNWVLAFATTMIKNANRAGDDTAQGDIIEAQRIARTYKYVGASDMSTYDDTISKETLDCWHECILQPVIFACEEMGLIDAGLASAILEAARWADTARILCPPRSMLEDAVLIDSFGRVKSGSYLTSTQDTDIRKAFFMAKAKYVDVEIAYTCWGDDGLFGSHDPQLKEKWNSTGDGLFDFVEKYEDEPSFLMKHVPDGYGYIARYATRTVNRETREEASTLEVAALGLAVRQAGLRGHPLERHFLPIMESAPQPRLAAAARLARVGELELSRMIATSNVPGANKSFESEDDLRRQVPEDLADAMIRLLGPDGYRTKALSFYSLLEESRKIKRYDALKHLQSDAAGALQPRPKRLLGQKKKGKK